MSFETFTKITELLAEGGSQQDVAQQCGVNSGTVSLITRGRHFYQLDEQERERRRRVNKQVPPTLEEIAERAAEIRRGWPAERYAEWHVPCFSLAQLGLA